MKKFSIIGALVGGLVVITGFVLYSLRDEIEWRYRLRGKTPFWM